MTKELLDYYKNDEFVAGVWQGKYAIKDEGTPDDMHRRMAKELGKIEYKYIQKEKKLIDTNYLELSSFGINHIIELSCLSLNDVEEYIFSYLKDYKWIIPQGSIMTMLGNPYKIGSLSNCFVIPSPVDSYGGILKADQQLVQLMKRRGGVGTNINKLRPSNTPVSNAAGTSTGAVSFMHRFSNSTREVAQNGRRGALMLLMSCLHPEIFDFVRIKNDLTKITGANISTMLTDKFMEAVEKNEDFICKFPIDSPEFLTISKSCDNEGLITTVLNPVFDLPEYNKIYDIKFDQGQVQLMKIKAKELFDLIIEMAWTNGEPGLAFIDNIHNWSPDSVYEVFKAIASNPCGEQWMQAYDACRLLCINLFSIVKNPYTKDAVIDFDKLYEISYIQQRLADVIVDLEIEYVNKIINKIKNDSEDEDVKRIELELWENVKITATASRRTGCGFTGMADMLAALNIKYNESVDILEEVMHTKMKAELDASIDMAITRGTFKGWDSSKEFINSIEPCNTFYTMLFEEFKPQVERMQIYGRRNVSFSTVAPTGTVSLVAKLINYANISAGIEPLFSVFYFRNKKINPSDGNVRVDFVDQNGDSWQTYPVVMAGLKEWYYISGVGNGKLIEDLSKDDMEDIYKLSPYFGSCANDIDWEKRIEIQAIVQKYTTNAISSTINLPNNVSKEVVGNIYMKAWKSGLKGVTVYRDGCRTGVLTNTETNKKDIFDYKDAIKRPKELSADLHVVTVKGHKYGVIIGLVESKPYELFAFNLPEDIKNSCNGKIVKIKKGHYNFECENNIIKDIHQITVHKDEQVLTRLVSGMLRHGAKPQFVMEQIDKCELEIVSFGKAISRVLKKYVKDEDMINRNICKDCGSSNVKMQEGCLTCIECGSSKCG